MPASGPVATNEYHTSSSPMPRSPPGSGVMDCVAPAMVPAVGTQVAFTGRPMAAAQSSLAGGGVGSSTVMVNVPLAGVGAAGP